MDYCEIILESVHKIVSIEMAKELKKLDGVLVVAQVLEVRDNNTYLVQESGGRRLAATADEELKIAINDYVYLNGATIIAKKLDNSQVPIEINKSLKDFIAFQKQNNALTLTNPRVCNRLLITAKVSNNVTKDSNYNISITVTNAEGRTYGLDFTKLDLIGRIGYLQGSLQKQIYSLDLGIITSAKATAADETVYSSIELALGSNAEGLANEMGLTLSSSVEELGYKTDVKGKVIDINFPISWTWIYTDNREVLRLEDATSNPSRKIKYYRYNELFNGGDEYGGLKWEAIRINNNIVDENMLLPNADITRIKAVIVNGQEIITSNELEFKNTKLTREGIISNMRLKFSDGRNGNYPLYSPSGNLLAKYSIESCKERKVEFTFVNTDESRDINSLVKKVEWTIDVDKINISNQIKNDPNVRNSALKTDSAGNQVVVCDTTNRVTNDETPKPNWHSFEFFIKNSIDFNIGLNDLISCAVTLDGDEEPYIASAPLAFTTDLAGNSGYSVAFELIERDTGKLCYSADAYKNYILNCRLWDKDGQELNAEDYDATASWYGSNAGGNRAFDLPTSTSWSFELTSRGSDNNSGWSSACHIIQFNIEIKIESDKTRTIKMLYPLAVHSKNFDAYYDGPTEFVYDASGRAESANLTNVVRFINSDGSAIEGTTFELVSASFTVIGDSWHPTLSGNGTTKRTLITPNYYESKLRDQSENYICHIRFISNGKYFTQPIILYQNTQFSSYIDEWGGELTIDNDKNAILSASIVAGTKDSSNQFTGIVAGDVENIADNGTSTITSGILGFREGVQSFGLNIDGTAFFGESGAGQIKFDGDGGSIQSGNYDGTSDKPQPTKGMLIDIDGGAIYSPGFSFDSSGNVNLTGNITWSSTNKPGTSNFENAIEMINGTDTSMRDWEAEQIKNYKSLAYSNSSGWSITKSGYDKIMAAGGVGTIIKFTGTCTINNKTETITIYFKVSKTPTESLVPVVGTGRADYPMSSIVKKQVEYLELLDQIKDSGDGIYNNGGSIAINASMIKTGLLQIGGNTDESDALLYANIADPQVKIAGWNIRKDSITKNNIGENNSFIMSSAGIPNTTPLFGNATTNDDWMLGIGSGFGVTTDGGVYATHGKIGAMTIAQINSLTGAGRNLVRDSSMSIKNSSYWSKTITDHLVTTWEDQHLEIYRDNTSDTKYYYRQQADTHNSLLRVAKGKIYTLSAEVRKLTNHDINAKSGVVYAPVSSSKFYLYFPEALSTTEWIKISTQFTIPSNLTFGNPTLDIELNGEKPNGIAIRNIKLEEGPVVTTWSAAPEDVEYNISQLAIKTDEIDASVGEMIVSYVATSTGEKGQTENRGSYFTATVTEATRPKTWPDMFYDGAILKINFSNTSKIIFTTPVNLNIGSASDETPDATDDIADYGFAIKPGGQDISSSNTLEIPQKGTVLFQFHASGEADANGYSLGYWDNKNISRNGAWSGLNVKTTGISADSLTREGDGYRFTLTPTGGFQVDSRAKTDVSWNNVITVNTSGLSLNGSLSATYLYAGEAKDDGIVFQTGNPDTTARVITTRIVMSTPKALTDADDNTTYISSGRIPGGYSFREQDITIPLGWNKDINDHVITLTQSNPNKPPETPVVSAKLTESQVRKYGIKISSNNDIYVPIYNIDKNEYEDIELTSLIAQLVLEN